jgi:hypothetical protein
VGQSAYPLLDFIGLIGHEVTCGDGSTENQTVKVTRNAAASIALACAETPYETAALMLERLAGIDINAMTEHRATDSVGAEFVDEVPVIDEGSIAEMTKKFFGNVIENRMEELKNSDNVAETIEKALINGPEGVLKAGYEGPVIKVMFTEVDGTGVPGRHEELAGVKGKQADGSAKTFEAKIGATFIVEYTADGRPLLTKDGEIFRDKKVQYTGTVRKVDDFGAMVYQHALDYGLNDVDAVVFLGDGAKWVWGIQKEYFPYALTAVDLYHAIEKIGSLVNNLKFLGLGSVKKKEQVTDDCIKLLKQGKVNDMISLIEKQPCWKSNEKKLQDALDYFRNNAHRMNYGIFAALGIYVGSGVIEAGVKVIVGNRMKNAGMHWKKDQANKMIALRCAIRNGKFFCSYLPDQSIRHNLAA